jgi:WD40 repeat protein
MNWQAFLGSPLSTARTRETQFANAGFFHFSNRSLPDISKVLFITYPIYFHSSILLFTLIHHVTLQSQPSHRKFQPRQHLHLSCTRYFSLPTTTPRSITMNLSLTDPFVLAQDYPESTSGSLRSGHATCVRFNRKGDFLAAGRVDGTVVIFDVETNGVARKLKGHTRQVQSLSWSRDGRHLLTSSQDWKCNIWDLQTGGIVRSVRFEAPVYIAEMHPWNQ